MEEGLAPFVNWLVHVTPSSEVCTSQEAILEWDQTMACRTMLCAVWSTVCPRSRTNSKFFRAFLNFAKLPSPLKALSRVLVVALNTASDGSTV